MIHTIDGLPYYVIQQGQGDDLLVLLHGFTGSVAEWYEILPVLAQDYAVLAIDLPGHGQTASPPDRDRYTMPRVAADCMAIIRQHDYQQLHILGYSMGGRLALYIATHYQSALASLTLESASSGLRTPEEQQTRIASDNALAERIERDGITAFVDFWQSVPLFQSQQRVSPDRRAELRQRRLQNNPLGLANSLRGMGTGQQPSLWTHLPQLKIPVHLLVGAEDTKFVQIAHEMHQLLPDATLTAIDETGHTIHFEKPDAFCETVLPFLQAISNNL